MLHRLFGHLVVALGSEAAPAELGLELAEQRQAEIATAAGGWALAEQGLIARNEHAPWRSAQPRDLRAERSARHRCTAGISPAAANEK